MSELLEYFRCYAYMYMYACRSEICNSTFCTSISIFSNTYSYVVFADINECREDSSICAHQCLNTRGSYECICNRGFRLSADNQCVGTTCDVTPDSVGAPVMLYTVRIRSSDVNECLEGLALCEFNCVNSLGSYRCSCPPGYMKTRNGLGCRGLS